MPSNAEFDPNPALVALAAAGVDFVVVGGVAGGAHGSAYVTHDLDIAYSRDPENLERLAEALRELGAKLRVARTPVDHDLPFQRDPQTHAEGGNVTFDTSLGPLDILAYMPGAPTYERLRASALVALIEGREIRIASLDHLVAMKEATGRDKDRLHASEYREISDLLRAPAEP